MKLTLITIGRTDDNLLKQLVQQYTTKLQYYIKFELVELPDIKNVKNMSTQQQKAKEGELLLKQLADSDYLVLWDEKGVQYTSKEFSVLLQKRMNSGIKNLIFVVGGPYGFDDKVYARANQKISLSKMTFSHQMVRLFIVEQFYRAFSILRNEPYHHD